MIERTQYRDNETGQWTTAEANQADPQDVTAVTDPVLAAHVRAVRTSPTHLPIRDALVRLQERGIFVSRHTVDNWVRRGWLPSVRPAAPETSVGRRSLLMIPVDALDGFELPRIGSGKRLDRRAA